MTDASVVSVSESNGHRVTELAPGSVNPVAVLTDPKTYSEFYDKVKAECDSFKPDVSTAKGRDAIKSQAYKVTRTKTALDEAGKNLNAGKRAEIDAVDAVRRKVREEFDTLAAEVRKPLTEWEATEAERTESIAATLRAIDAVSLNANAYSAALIRETIADFEAMEFDADIYQDRLGEAITTKTAALANLRALLGTKEQAERDAAELAELRRQKDEREARDQLEREERARQEQAARDELARQVAATQAEQTRKDEIAAAEQRAEQVAAEKAQREAASKIEAANAEASRLREEQAQRERQEAQLVAEREAREKDRAHRSAVMKAAKEAIMANSGVPEDAAKKVVLAIVAGEVPNVKVEF